MRPGSKSKCNLGFDKLARLHRRRLCVRRVEAGLQVRAQGVQGHVHPGGGNASDWPVSLKWYVWNRNFGCNFEICPKGKGPGTLSQLLLFCGNIRGGMRLRSPVKNLVCEFYLPPTPKKIWQNIFDPFRGLYRAPKPTLLRWVYSLSHNLGLILTCSDPPANPVKLFWFKMTWKGVPHIVLHVLCSTCTSGGYLRPSEVRFRGIFGPFGRFLLYK